MGFPLYLAVGLVESGAVLLCSVGCDELRFKLLSPGRCKPETAEASEHRRFGCDGCHVGFKNNHETIVPRFLNLSTEGVEAAVQEGGIGWGGFVKRL